MLETKDIIIILGVCIGLLIFGMYFQDDQYAVKVHEAPVEKAPVELEAPVEEEIVEEEVPVEEEVVEEDAGFIDEVPAVEEEAPADVKKVMIDLERNYFTPKNIVVEPMTEVTFENVDDRRHRIACYYEKQRMYYGDILDPGDSFSYVFEKVGKYRCRDAVFGYWLDLEVVSESEAVVQLGAGSAFVNFIRHNFIQSLMVITLVAIFSAHYYDLKTPKKVLTRKKKQKRRNK
jgi:plastocyanin